jgi:O-antigen ligase
MSMAGIHHPEPAPGSRAQWAVRLETATFFFLIAILAWAPFPLGSNRPWSWSLLSLLVAACWVLWAVSRMLAPRAGPGPIRFLMPPLLLLGAALLWGVIQLLPFVPQGWAHPVWQIASDALGQPAGQRISIDPWRTVTELMKLTTYIMAGVLAFFLCQRPARAKQFLVAVLFIVTAYAVYGLLLTMIGYSQNQMFYSIWGYRRPVSGPFVLRNSYATFLGLGLILAAVRLYPSASAKIITGRGARQHALTTLQYIVGEGVWGILALAAIFSVLVATASRAGFLSAMVGIFAILCCSLFVAGRRAGSGWALVGVVVIFLGSLLLFSLNGDRLQTRFNALVEAGGLDIVRAAFWDAGSRMITDAPWLGFGLGSYERAYPLYANQVLPFVMDKAHNDYLEFAAGFGLPAAIAWCAGLAWCAYLCARGVVVRHRHRIYPMAAFGATALVGFHSMFDFSMQIPAVALTYAVIMGMGLAQAFSGRDLAETAAEKK